jgi:hypothetical protein
MSDVPALMKRCQIGVPRGPNAYDDLHSILAECYGTLGALDTENARLREALHKLVDAANDSDGAAYGALSTAFVRDIAEDALKGSIT